MRLLALFFWNSRRYAVAIGSTAKATLACGALDPALDAEQPYPTYSGALAALAIFVGRGPSVEYVWFTVAGLPRRNG